MTETEKKALALVNEACKSDFKDLGITYRNNILDALLLAIEQHETFRQEVSDAVELLSEEHEAFRQEVSDAVEEALVPFTGCKRRELLGRFIIAKPDPLVEAMNNAMDPGDFDEKDAEALRAAMLARGYEFTKIGEKAGE